MKRKLIAISVFVLILIPLFTGCVEKDKTFNKKPMVEIKFPRNYDSVSKIVTISGNAFDPNGNQTIKSVEIKINNTWIDVDGLNDWSYTWNTYNLNDGYYTISVRAWDGALYSDNISIIVSVNNPDTVESDEHKWAVFTFAGNYPEQNESKLGNGGLFLAEEIAKYLIEEKDYPTSNIFILFDDGWIRANSGYGKRITTLQERVHEYDIFYAAATKDNFIATITDVVGSSNNFKDSEVFIWLSGHGLGDNTNPISGGKFFERSAVLLWDDILYDDELGSLLQNLESKKTCVIVDTCYSGGFVDKTIFNLPEIFLFDSGIPANGRVVISGASKFRTGFSSVSQGPIFSNLWFYALYSGDGDGYRSGLFNRGRPSKLELFKNGRISVEEAFYYASYTLRNDKEFKDFSKMEPQISDQYPRKGLLGSSKEMILG